MPTTTVRSVGTSSRDYSTLQAWEDACPSNLVTADEIWKGECYNDSEFLITSGTVLTVSGMTTDKTRYLWLTPAAGHAYKDASGADSLPLRYDQSKGVGIKDTGTYAIGILCGTRHALFEYLQWNHDTTISYSTGWGLEGGVWRGCLLETRKHSTSYNNPNIAGPRYINSLLVDRSSSGISPYANESVNLNSCTVVRPSDLTSGGTGANTTYGVYPTVKSSAFLGFATNFAGTIGSYPAGGYNASNSSSAPGSNNQTSLTYADQFENVNDSTRDWRVKSGAALISNGTRAQGTEGDLDLLGTNDLDILGRTRSTTTPTIGCWEVISSTPTLAIADAAHAHLADGLTLTQQHVLTVADASHAHLADSITLTQAHVLAIADALHAHAADNVVLSVEGTLAVADALHGHTADSLTLTQQHVLAVADALHAHLADNLTLAVGGTTLAIADALHAHLADGLTLTQLHILTVADALHAHLADTLTLSVPGAAILHDRVLIVRGENRTLVILPESRVLAV